jgi:membrane-associated phospholipid phosphatase
VNDRIQKLAASVRRPGRVSEWKGWCFGVAVLVFLAFGVDAALAAWFKRLEMIWAKMLAEGISKGGDFPVLLGVGLLGMAGFWKLGWKRAVRVMRLMLIASALSGGVTNGIRYLVGRARPVAKVAPGWYGPRAAFLGGSAHKFHSFPSAHTACLAGFLFPLVVLWRRRRIRMAAAVALVLILAMAWSRMQHRVHHLSDVLAGIWVGSVCALRVCGMRPRSGLGSTPVQLPVSEGREA